MQDAQRQMLKAREIFDSAGFKEQMEDAQRQMSKAKEMLDSPEFKQQMEDLQKKLQSDEWQDRVDGANRKFDKQTRKLEKPGPGKIIIYRFGGVSPKILFTTSG
jgi:hypothetical protein